VKIYPTQEQEQQLLRTAGACRWVYNHYLEAKQRAYLEEHKNITLKTMSADLTQLRKATDWLSEVQLVPLQQSLRQLDVAYNSFFRGQTGFPNFKSRYSKQSFRKTRGWSVRGSRLTVTPGLNIRFKGAFPVIHEGTLTISRTPSGQWFASAQGFEERRQPALSGAIGLDMGLKHLVVTSGGEKVDNPRFLDGLSEQIKSAQKALSRKQKGSNRRAKAKLVLARLHNKVDNKRTNYLHHVSKAIVGKNHATIVVEDLAVRNMMRNHKLARSIGDASWSELLRMVTYKQEWAGGEVVKIGRFYPSSKTCSNCYYIMSTMPLSVRSWECPRCHSVHDRDINAAKVILQQAGNRLGVEAGDGRKTVRRSPRVTRPMKRGDSLISQVS